MPPDNHMPTVVMALIVFFPLGLVALCYCFRVGRCWQANDREGARRASLAARSWCIRAYMVPVLLFGFILVYWGYVALREDFRPYMHNAEIQELLNQGSSSEDE